MAKGKVKQTWWKLSRADNEVSKAVRDRDKNCMFPGCNETERLQCSHYYGRAKNSTRFYMDNLIALCWKHHYGDKYIGWEYAKQRKELHGRDGEYTLFMKKWLGKKRWDELERRSKLSMKQNNAIIELMELLSVQK